MTLPSPAPPASTCSTVDPGPAVLDDFEDGDLIPSLRPFSAWSCAQTFPPRALDCDVTEGFGLVRPFDAFSIRRSAGRRPAARRGPVRDRRGHADRPDGARPPSRSTSALTHRPTAVPERRTQSCVSSCGARPPSTRMAPHYATSPSFIASRTRTEWSQSAAADAVQLRSGGRTCPGPCGAGVRVSCAPSTDSSSSSTPQVADGQTVAGVLSIDNVRVLR